MGERQLVALVRAYVADPDLLVLDEATSAVDPATEVRLQRTLDAVTRGRTTVAIAHRLSTAEAADEVIVVDAGPGGAARPARRAGPAGGAVRGAARVLGGAAARRLIPRRCSDRAAGIYARRRGRTGPPVVQPIGAAARHRRRTAPSAARPGR